MIHQIKTFLCCGILLLTIASCAVGQQATTALPNDKEQIIKDLDSQFDKYSDIAQQIWNWAELGYQEEKSSSLLQETLKEAG